jgi:hypothetical protein
MLVDEVLTKEVKTRRCSRLMLEDMNLKLQLIRLSISELVKEDNTAHRLRRNKGLLGHPLFRISKGEMLYGKISRQHRYRCHNTHITVIHAVDHLTPQSKASR